MLHSTLSNPCALKKNLVFVNAPFVCVQLFTAQTCSHDAKYVVHHIFVFGTVATLEDGDEADQNASLCWLDFLFEVGGQTTFFQLISGVNLAHGMMQLTRANLSLSPRLISSQCDKMLE